MSAEDPFEKYVKVLYHFTDRRNLPSIREHGGLYSLVRLREMGLAVQGQIYPGGNQWSHDADAIKQVDRYVHLTLKKSHPMEYVARNEGRIADCIYLEIDPVVASWDGVVYTPDVANKSGVPLYLMSQSKDIIDYDVLFNKHDRRRSDIQARLQLAEKAEILVPVHIPLEYIRNLP